MIDTRGTKLRLAQRPVANHMPYHDTHLEIVYVSGHGCKLTYHPPTERSVLLETIE